MKKLLVLALTTILLTSGLPANAALKAGGVCKISGQTKLSGNKVLTCSKKGKKLVWIEKKLILPKPSETSTKTSLVPEKTPIVKIVSIPTNFKTSWEGQDFRMDFNFPPQLVDDKYDNTQVKNFQITLFLNDGTSKMFIVNPQNETLHTYWLRADANMRTFGRPQTSFLRVELSTVTSSGTISSPVNANTATFQSLLPVPIVSVSAVASGYRIDIKNFSEAIKNSSFSTVVVEESVTPVSTPGYIPPFVTIDQKRLETIVIIANNSSGRWVRVKFLDSFGTSSLPSGEIYVSPCNPVASKCS